jgi:geranylgeranylglycerol-phosphate geranylgeranyltransferase
MMGSPTLWTLVPFLVAFWAHDTSSNLVGTLRDVSGDRAGGYQTVPVRHGNAVGVWVALLLYCLAVPAGAAGGLLPRPAPPQSRDEWFLVALALTATLGVAAFLPLVAQRDRTPVRVALRAHELLVLERLGFAAAVVGLGFGLPRALSLLVPMLILTGWTQSKMRAGYELGPAALDAPEPAASQTATSQSTASQSTASQSSQPDLW